MVLGIGVVTLFLSILMLLDSDTVVFMFFFGFGYLLIVGYVVAICYVFVQLLLRRDAWLYYFSALTAAFGLFTAWLLVPGTRLDAPTVFAFGGIPYSLATIALAAAMSSRSLGNNDFDG